MTYWLLRTVLFHPITEKNLNEINQGFREFLLKIRFIDR
jgi:hypothetical protein